eukprot:PITA_26944
MVEFCHKYHIILGHSTSYHLQGNGLVESSNKSLVNIIKMLMEINKKSWHKRLVNALWADRVIQKKSISTSPFELVYGVDTVFPTSLATPIVKLLQEAGSEEEPMQRRLNQMVHLQQTREEVFKNTSKLQEKIKKIYDRKAKVDKFQVDNVVLKWDARNEEKGKHRGSRHLFAAAKRVLSPPEVEGASLLASTTQMQDKGKKPMHDERPSGEQEAEFILIQDDDADVESARLRMTIRE